MKWLQTPYKWFWQDFKEFGEYAKPQPLRTLALRSQKSSTHASLRGKPPNPPTKRLLDCPQHHHQTKGMFSLTWRWTSCDVFGSCLMFAVWHGSVTSQAIWNEVLWLWRFLCGLWQFTIVRSHSFLLDKFDSWAEDMAPLEESWPTTQEALTSISSMNQRWWHIGHPSTWEVETERSEVYGHL